MEKRRVGAQQVKAVVAVAATNFTRPMRLALLVALALATPACHRAPSARLLVTRYVESNQTLLECRVRGISTPVQFRWTFGAALHPPRTPAGSTVLAGTDLKPKSGTGEAACEATGANGEHASVATSILEPKLVVKPVIAATVGGPITVDGTDLGSKRNPSDTLWLVPRWGRPHAADHDCHDAAWSDIQIRACVPDIAPGHYQLRVESGNRLGVGGFIDVSKK
jgi:hypothetical protein